MHLAAVGSLLYQLYLADMDTLLAKLTRILEPGFVVILCGRRGPGTKKHMGAYAYTKRTVM